ncbi:hypothetical protein VTH06DRAFT_5095 [Thermothelomyces fergusii]
MESFIKRPINLGEGTVPKHQQHQRHTGGLRGHALVEFEWSSGEIRACWKSTREARSRPAAAISGYRPIDRPYQRPVTREAGKDEGDNGGGDS